MGHLETSSQGARFYLSINALLCPKGWQISRRHRKKEKDGRIKMQRKWWGRTDGEKKMDGLMAQLISERRQ